MCIWWKSSLPSCSGTRHTVINQITRAAWWKAASNCICWIQSQQHGYGGNSLTLPRGGQTFKPMLHYPNPEDERGTSLNPKWVSSNRSPWGTALYLESGLLYITYNLKCKVRTQCTLRPNLHHHCLALFEQVRANRVCKSFPLPWVKEWKRTSLGTNTLPTDTNTHTLTPLRGLRYTPLPPSWYPKGHLVI